MPRPDDYLVGRYADTIMAAVDAAIAHGDLPANVRGFTDLHTYLDANDFLEHAGVPYNGSDVSIALIVAVQREVTGRLAAPTRPYCTFGRCVYPRHDHTAVEGPDRVLATPSGPLRCLDCGQPAHYDGKLRRLRHDDPVLDDRGCPNMTVGDPDPDPGDATISSLHGIGQAAGAVQWVDAWVAAGGDPGCYDFGPYPAQVAHGLRHPGGGVAARFRLDTVRLIARDQCYAPPGSSIGVPIEVVDGQVRHRGAPHRPLAPGPDGWWHLDDEPWSWLPSNLGPDHAVWRPLFAPLPEPGTAASRRCTVCGAVDAIDTAVVASRFGAAHEDTIRRCCRCGSTEVGYAESPVRAERAPWPAPAPGPAGADGTGWDEREGLPGGWWRLPYDLRLRVRTVVRAADGLILSSDLHDGFGPAGRVYMDLRALTAWDTGRDAASPGRVAFAALTDRFPDRFTTVHDVDRPGTLFLTLPLMHLTDEITDAVLATYRGTATAGNARDGGHHDPHPGDQPEHDCQAAGTLDYVADYGAPGIGQAWTCTACGRPWSRVGGIFWPAESGVHILSPEDVE